MARQEKSFARDMTFHINRRAYGKDIPATDIDFLEFDKLEPVLLWEAKSDKSHWRKGRRTASMIAQWKLAERAEIPYRVIEHSDDWSQVTVYEVKEWKGWMPIIGKETAMTLTEWIAALYAIRKREVPNGVKVPDKLGAIIFSI